MTIPPGPNRLTWADLMMIRQDWLGFAMKLARKYGDIVYVPIIGQSGMYLLSNPHDIRDVLVTNQHYFHGGKSQDRIKILLGEGLFSSEGDFHRRQRKLIQPVFHQERITAYSNTVVEYTQRMSKRWQNNIFIDLFQEITHLTQSIISDILFDVDIDAEDSEIREILTAPLGIYNRYATLPFSELLTLLPLPSNEILFKLPLPYTKKFRRTRSKLDATLYQIIEEHRTSSDRGDILSMILMMEGNGEDSYTMSSQQLRDELMTLFIAGSETVASSITWALYLISLHAQVEENLQIELSKVLNGRTPNFEDLKHLKYTRMILSEAIRLYPPGPALGRRTIKEYQIGQYTFPIGTRIIMSPYIVHRDPRFYPDPERFDPERFDSEAISERPKFAYFPFGGGQRHCLGEGFVWMEGVLILAILAQKWQFRLIPGIPVRHSSFIVLRPKYGIRMSVNDRGTREI